MQPALQMSGQVLLGSAAVPVELTHTPPALDRQSVHGLAVEAGTGDQPRLGDVHHTGPYGAGQHRQLVHRFTTLNVGNGAEAFEVHSRRTGLADGTAACGVRQPVHGPVGRAEQLSVQALCGEVHGAQGRSDGGQGLLLDLGTLQMGRTGQSGEHPAQYRNGHGHRHHVPRLAQLAGAPDHLTPGPLPQFGAGGGVARWVRTRSTGHAARSGSSHTRCAGRVSGSTLGARARNTCSSSPSGERTALCVRAVEW